jgi:membrane protein implicated in regulation of membrane protease activity
MTGWQIAALIVAILLLLPGGCVLFIGVLVAEDPQYRGAALLLLPIAFVILGSAGLLFWAAFRRRRPTASGPPA